MNTQKPLLKLTSALVVSNVAIWWLFSSASPQHANTVIERLAFSPVRLTASIQDHDTLSTVLETLRAVSSIFVHDFDKWHVLANMGFLLLFGFALEARLGASRYALVYFASGLLTCAVYFALCPDGRPSLGASSAVCGVMGAFLILLLKRRPLRSAIALLMLALNLLGATNPAAVSQTGFAFWAHLSGFAIGALVSATMTLEFTGGQTDGELKRSGCQSQQRSTRFSHHSFQELP